MFSHNCVVQDQVSADQKRAAAESKTRRVGSYRAVRIVNVLRCVPKRCNPPPLPDVERFPLTVLPVISEIGPVVDAAAVASGHLPLIVLPVTADCARRAFLNAAAVAAGRVAADGAVGHRQIAESI